LATNDFYTPTDIDALRMENELLAFEAHYLRGQLSARLAEYERSATESKNRLEESERRLEESERRLAESERSAAQLRERLAEAERAEQDIVLLLQRLANSPFGWFFASRQNFRILEQRYLGNGG
jgi:DNA repair exonuclease SbcCD ATPase subunit